jgi:hypothetical protein
MTITNRSGQSKDFDEPVARLDDFVHYAALATINTPRIIDRHQHMPHQRAERELLKGICVPAKFPLRAWTDIILKVGVPPDDKSASGDHEAHLTGEKCLHYCRSHLRVRFGYLEYVQGHWRGNPALGIKHSRYRMETEECSSKPVRVSKQTPTPTT